MQNVQTMSDDRERSARDDICRLIVLDIKELIKRTRTSIAFIELAIIQENLKNEECAQDIEVLDDVTPRYAAAARSLMNCELALHGTQDAMLRCTVPGNSDARYQHLEQGRAARRPRS